MKMSKKFRLIIILAITIHLFSLLVISARWTWSCLQVDFNSACYTWVKSTCIDFGEEIGTKGDDLHQWRLDAKESSDPYLRISANTKYSERLTITLFLVVYDITFIVIFRYNVKKLRCKVAKRPPAVAVAKR